MSTFITLTKRNLRLFLRDRMTVFFSFLSTLVLVMLYFLFIAKIYVAGMDDPAAGGIAMSISGGAKNFIVYLQMMAGVLTLNSMSLATGAFTTIARDFEDKRVDCLSLTPARPHEMILAYYATGLIASFAINTFTWLISFLIIGLASGYWLAFGVFMTVCGVLFVASLISCSIMLLITSLVKSSAALGVINGISGTFFGFLCGIYMPYSNLGDSTKAVGAFLPFTHITIWLKQTVLGNAFSQVGIAQEFKEILYRDYFSATDVSIGGAPLWVMLIFSGVLGFLCLAGSYALLHKRIKGNRG